MSIGITDEINYIAIASAIRNKAGTSDTYTPSEMAPAIDALTAGAGGEVKTISVIADVASGTFGLLLRNAIQEITLPDIIQAGRGAFSDTINLKRISLPNLISLGDNAFSGCKNLLEVDMPKCESLGAQVFANLKSLNSVNIPMCTEIKSITFYQCTSLSEVNFPVCTKINDRAFSDCSSLTKAYLPECTEIDGRAFWSCASLSKVYLPKCTKLDDAFEGCSSLEYIDLPNLTSCNIGAFNNCSSIKYVYFPNYTGTLPRFSGNSSLSYVVAKCTVIPSSVFINDYNLITLDLTGVSTVPGLSNNVFTGTPIGGYSDVAGQYGSVYVPSSLYSNFLTTNRWSKIADRITSDTPPSLSREEWT